MPVTITSRQDRNHDPSSLRVSAAVRALVAALPHCQKTPKGAHACAAPAHWRVRWRGVEILLCDDHLDSRPLDQDCVNEPLPWADALRAVQRELGAA
jgi:hypothetical protein